MAEMVDEVPLSVELCDTGVTCGGKLAGAGGGGFTIVVARDVQAASSLQFELAARYAGTSVGVWPCTIPESGTAVASSGRA